ncbi:MAG: hypothetical protein KDI27_01740 [Gammaproteobacteria bacterium]|nr:hypothetical protein [Gammaproteobacteria bacterium]MCP5417232.1 hypothetical protein [Chromatiaceae bacterium]
MEEAVEKLRPQFEILLAIRDDNDQGLTQQGMAEKLNEMCILSLTGQPWSKYSVRRILKKLNMQTLTSANLARNSSNPIPITPAAAEFKERDLDEHSPLRQWSYYESIRTVMEELTAEPFTPQKLASKLNEKNVPTNDGKPWSELSVTRALRTLKPSHYGIEISDNEIRKRIRQGWYDTETERFIAVPKTQGKDDHPLEKSAKKAKKEKKMKDNKRKGGKKKKK